TRNKLYPYTTLFRSEKFEHIANQLYEQLKEKEDAEEHLNVEMKATFTIDKMINQTEYINILANKFINLQFHVQQARNKMETAQEDRKSTRLNSSHVS